MELRYNINKIHSDLTSRFYKNEVKIEEKSNLKLGNYFEISIINEDKEVKMIVSKKELEGSSFNWAYLSNPLNESSDFVERNSNIETIANDISEIFEKKRFDTDYLNELNK